MNTGCLINAVSAVTHQESCKCIPLSISFMDFEMKIQPALISHLLIFVSEKKCKKMCRRDQTSRSLSVESNTSLSRVLHPVAAAAAD